MALEMNFMADAIQQLLIERIIEDANPHPAAVSRRVESSGFSGAQLCEKFPDRSVQTKNVRFLRLPDYYKMLQLRGSPHACAGCARSSV